MKFLIEVFTLIMFFALFRLGVKRFMPKKKQLETLSVDSLKALRRFRLRYFALLLTFTSLGTLSLKFVLQWARNFWIDSISADYLGVFPLQDFGLWYPSLLLAFLLSSILAFRTNRKLQKDGLSFFLEEIQEEAQGYSSFGAKRWIQYGLGVLLFLLLLFPQFHDSVRLGSDAIEWRQGWGELSRISKTEIDSMGTEQGHPVFYYRDSLKLDLDDYRYHIGPINEFLRN